MGPGSTASRPMWRKFANAVWNRRSVVIWSVVVTVVVGGVYWLLATPVLETTATVQVRVLDQLLPDSEVTASNALAVQPGIIRSTAVVALAIASPAVHDLPLVQGDYGTIGAIQSRLSVRSGDEPDQFQISLDSTEPGDAEKLLDSLVSAYVSLETSQRVQSSDALTADLIDQQKKNAGELTAAKSKFDDANKRRAELEPNSDSRVQDAQQRSDASTALADARQKADDARGSYQRAIQFFGGEDKLNEAALAVATIPPISDEFDPDVLADQILQLRHQLAQQSRGAGGADIRQLAQLSAEYATGVRDRYQAAMDLQNQAQAAFDKLENRSQRVDALEDECSRLQGDVDRLTAIDSELADRLNHSVATSESRVSIAVLHSASTAPTPVWPRPLSVLGGAALIGLILGAGLALGIDKFDSRLRDPSDAKNSADAPLLGRLPASPLDSMSLAERGQCVLLKPSDPCSLAYRALRRDLERELSPGADKIIVITSPTESRGTSVLASNLAIATARSGKRVVLLDGHHTLCAINEIFGIEDNVGLSDVITGRLKINAALHVTGLEGLEVMPVGSPEEDWAELLNHPDFYEVLTELTERFDRVIIDGGCARSDECRIISAFCDATVVLADARKCSRHDLRAAADGLRAVGANITGIVVKGVGRRVTGAEMGIEAKQIRGFWSRLSKPKGSGSKSRMPSNGNGVRPKDADAGLSGGRPDQGSQPEATEIDGLRIF
jgi:capsular exopolysaccharide synthesis family protein